MDECKPLLPGFKQRFYADKLPAPVPGQAPLVAEKVSRTAAPPRNAPEMSLALPPCGLG